MRLAELDLGGHGEDGSKQDAVRHREPNRPDLEFALLPRLLDVVTDSRVWGLVVNVVEDIYAGRKEARISGRRRTCDEDMY